MSKKSAFLYLDTFLLTYCEKIYRALSKHNKISLRHADALAHSSFFLSLTSIPDVNQGKAYKYTTNVTCIISKIHIVRQFIIERATNKCRLTISICQVHKSRIVRILVCRWLERLMQYDHANRLLVFHFLASGFGSESWMTDPFGLTAPTNGTPSVNDVGNGQQSSYQERTYTLPGSMTYYEWSS